jgi:hypothetical protein
LSTRFDEIPYRRSTTAGGVCIRGIEPEEKGLTNLKTASKQEMQFGEGTKREGEGRRTRKRQTLAGMLLGLIGLSAAAGSMRADTLVYSNTDPITTPDSGQAALYPSQIGLELNDGTITAVRVTLHNITHHLWASPSGC